MFLLFCLSFPDARDSCPLGLVLVALSARRCVVASVGPLVILSRRSGDFWLHFYWFNGQVIFFITALTLRNTTVVVLLLECLEKSKLYIAWQKYFVFAKMLSKMLSNEPLRDFQINQEPTWNWSLYCIIIRIYFSARQILSLSKSP